MRKALVCVSFRIVPTLEEGRSEQSVTFTLSVSQESELT